MAETSDGEWFGGKRWTGYAAIGVLAVIGLCIGFLLYQKHGGHSTVVGQPTATSSPPSPAAGSSRAHSVAPSDQVVPTNRPPAGVSWTLVNGYAMPASAADGPFHVAGTVATGFRDTPTGALLALVNAQLRLAAGTTAGCRAEVLAAFEHTPAAAQVSQQCGPPAGPQQRYQVAGYAFVSYTPARAAITYAVREEQNAALIEVTGSLTWASGDWLVALPGAAGSGNPLGPTAAIDSLTGLVAWAGA